MFRKTIELAASLFVVAMLAWALWETREWPSQSQIFPWSIGSTVLGLALVQLAIAVRNVIGTDRFRATISDNDHASDYDREASRPARDTDQKTGRRKAIIIQLWIVIFFTGIWLLGFKVGAFVLTFAFLKIAADERWGLSTGFAFMAYLFFLVVFDFALEVPLRAGLVAEYLELNSLDMYVVNPFLDLVTRIYEGL